MGRSLKLFLFCLRSRTPRVDGSSFVCFVCLFVCFFFFLIRNTARGRTCSLEVCCSLYSVLRVTIFIILLFFFSLNASFGFTSRATLNGTGKASENKRQSGMHA